MSTPKYCTLHDYEPPENSGFALCPKCELASSAGSALPKPRKPRRKTVHVCAACKAEFTRKLECWAHMETCEEIKRLRAAKAVVPAECERCMATPCMCDSIPAIKELLKEQNIQADRP